MLSYFTLIHSGIESAGNPLSDGRKLAQQCITQLDELNDSSEFPPRLLILLASPAYVDSLKSEQLLSGVLEKFGQAGHPAIPLIGCSVAAVFFGQRIYREGALLVCLASRLCEAKVSVVSDASHSPKPAVSQLLHDLELLDEKGNRIHSFVDRTIIALFPGFGGNKYLAPELHEALREQLVAPISIFGGVASANDPKRIRSGVLFANKKVYRDAIVAARLEHGTPLGISLTAGLVDTHKSVSVAKVDPKDKRIIAKFHEGPVAEVMKTIKLDCPVPLFADLAVDRDPVVHLPVEDGQKIKLAREIGENKFFHLLKVDPEYMTATLRQAIEHSLHRAFLKNPIAAFGFRCTSLLRNEKEVGLDLETETDLIERDLTRIGVTTSGTPFIGGFVDGEAGLDHNGKSVLSNWSSSTMVFGDELRFRTPVYRGFEKVTEFSGMKMADDQQEGIDRLTKLIYDIGFPGAMLSLCLFNQEGYALVGRAASGPRFERLLKQNLVYPFDSDDVLAVVARSKRPKAIIDSRLEKSPSMKAASREGIVSQYLVPLLGYDGQVTSILQIDLGDLSYDVDLYETETSVLGSLGNIVSVAVNRILESEERKLIHHLDRAMNPCQAAETVEQGLQHYLEYALDAFGLNKGDSGGHIRLAQEDSHSLRLIAGTGTYFEAARKGRQQIGFADPSPTAQAFRDEKLSILNDPPSSEAHNKTCAQLEKQPAIHRALSEVGSYANVPFISERNERGMINLVADKAWFFASFHRPVLEALGHRVGFLLESLRRKERESFLLAVSPPFSKIRKLDDSSAVLANELKLFAKAIKAEVASAYLWDPDRERYILRAQHGWHNPEWVDAAYYEKTDFWTGTSALAGQPHYIPDLGGYYHEYRGSNAKHIIDAFGRELSPEHTVEAIALQLRIGGNRFGVLCFYRQITPGAESGFVTTDTELLQQGADNFSGLISFLESTRREEWKKLEQKRRQEVFESTVPVISKSSNVKESFEVRVSRQLLKSYYAIRVNFFEVEVHEGKPRAIFKSALVRNAKTKDVEELPVLLEDANYGLIERALRINFSGERQLQTERVGISPTEERNPQRVALSKLVKRVCIPLFNENTLRGLIDIHWAFDKTSRQTINYQHGEAFLLMIGDMVGAAYHMDQVKRRMEFVRNQETKELDQEKLEIQEAAELSRDAYQATTAWVLKHHHEIRDVITQIHVPLEEMKELRQRAGKREKSLLNLMSVGLRQGLKKLERMTQIGQSMIRPTRERIPVWEIIDQCVEWCRPRYDYEVEVYTPKKNGKIFISANRELITTAFRYLLDNAFKYMEHSEKRQVIIRVEKLKMKGNVVINIEDTGPGMSENFIRLLREEFFSEDGRTSLGVMISRLILGNHSGSLRYESVLGTGTKTIITLPLDTE